MKTFRRFYPIAPSVYMLCRLVNAGARLVQLRIKDRKLLDIREEAHEAHRVCQNMGAQLVLNDYWEVAIDEGCDYIHLGQDDLTRADIKAIRKADIKIGVSTHSHDELETALSIAPDYIALGPIYPTTLKVMPFAPQGLPKITEWKQRVGATPLVAIGGITLDRASGCLQAGADCVAVVNDVVNAADPEAQVDAYITRLEADL